jgi:hypothetical protein
MRRVTGLVEHETVWPRACRNCFGTRRRAGIVQMMDWHKRRDPVAPPVFVRDEPDALKTKVDEDLSVVLALFTVVVGALFALALCLQRDYWTAPALDMLILGSLLSTVAHAVVYPIYRGIRTLTTRGASKPHPVALTLWPLSVGALFMFIAIPLYSNISSGRPRIAKAQADTRGIANAVSIYVAHCSGLPPADSARTDCPVAAEPGGPHPVPKSLFVQQTNARGEVGGPFLSSWPQLPAGWTGAANSYAYTVLSDSKFLICAVGDSTGADSNGGAPTVCGNRTHPGSGTTGIDDR